jgi:hypothetical protein
MLCDGDCETWLDSVSQSVSHKFVKRFNRPRRTWADRYPSTFLLHCTHIFQPALKRHYARQASMGRPHWSRRGRTRERRCLCLLNFPGLEGRRRTSQLRALFLALTSPTLGCALRVARTRSTRAGPLAPHSATVVFSGPVTVAVTAEGSRSKRP